MTPRVWVTGAGGFCGGHLARLLLAAEVEVVAWVRRPVAQPVDGVRYLVGDLTDRRLVREAITEAPPDQLFHLAAMADPRACEADVALAERVNVGVVKDLVDALVHVAPDCALLYASTCHVYGVPDVLPLSESHPLRPRGTYAETKARGEAAALAGVEQGLRVVVSRAFHQSGPGHGEAFALGSWAAQIASGAREVRVGDLSVCRDYTDVRDVGRGMIHLMDVAPSGAVVNLCSERAPSLQSMLEGLIGGRPIDVRIDAARVRPAEVPVLYGDASQARNLGWEPLISLETMLADLLESYSSRTSILPSPSVS